MGNLETMCSAGHDLTIPNALYTNTNKNGTICRRCRVCYRAYQRNIRRRKSGIPLDTPVRAYTRLNPRGSQTARKRLMELIRDNPEVVPTLLKVASEHANSNHRSVVAEALSPAHIY
jgi:hypothetical protein